MDEGRKRVLATVAGILVARYLKTTADQASPKSSLMSLRKFKSGDAGLRGGWSRFGDRTPGVRKNGTRR
jgi:hypothetical protein